MIYTITLDPLLDNILEIDELIYDDVNTVLHQRRNAEGKGINVSRVIKELGGQSVAMGFAGGYNGLEITGRLISDGIPCEFTTVQGESQSHITISQRKKKLQTLLGTPCPFIHHIEVNELLKKIEMIPDKSFVVIGGNIPPGIPGDFFARLIAPLRKKEIRVFLDTDHEALQTGFRAGPFLIKPNIHEFGRLTGNSSKNIGDIIKHASSLRDTAEYIVVSLGSRGAVGFSKQDSYHAIPPAIQVLNSSGAGDALVAGMVFAFHNGASFKEALALGTACGTATALQPGTRLCKINDVVKIEKDINIEKF